MPATTEPIIIESIGPDGEPHYRFGCVLEYPIDERDTDRWADDGGRIPDDAA